MSPTSFPHPSFGPCEIVPSLVAIRWQERRPASAVLSTLSKHALALASESPRMPESGAPKDKAAPPLRDPRALNINQSETLTWAVASKTAQDTMAKVRAEEGVAWVSPVYRALDAEKGPTSYFAIDPTMLLVSEKAVAQMRNLTALDDAAMLDEQRGRLVKGFVAYRLPRGNAVELTVRLGQDTRLQPGAIKLSNIPYIAPTTACGCSGGSKTVSARRGKCSPATIDVVPNDRFYPLQWGLQRIHAPRAWSITQGDPNVVVAVLDEGVELAHPDLHLWPISYSTITHTNDGSPVGNHGTACSGIIGGRIENTLGVSGLAGQCSVMAIATNFADTEVAEGLYFAADNGARVVSMSFGVYASWGVWDFALIEAALQYCHERNVVLVAASGNENLNVSRFPGSDPRCITVGGSNRDDVRKAVGDTSVESFWGACYGPDLDVVAPCLEIPTTDRLGAAGYDATDYDLRFNGTSSATPHVAALAALMLSVDASLTNVDVLRILAETADKIGGYAYQHISSKPFGTWNEQVGYGRINAERALVVTCSSAEDEQNRAPCGVDLPTPDPCCVSPCDAPWRTDEQCLIWREGRFLQMPIDNRRDAAGAVIVVAREYVEFKVDYDHKFCLLGKQHGPLLFTQTLLPGEKVTLYHSDRYRRITSEQDRYSVQTTFMQFLSAVHQARVTNRLDALSDTLASVKTSASTAVGGGLAALLGLPSGEGSTVGAVTDHNMLRVTRVADTFDQSVIQATQLTHAERSVVISNYEEKEALDISARTLQNDNACRAVTYFVRKVMDLYAMSTAVSGITFRVFAPGVSAEWHPVDDLTWLEQGIRAEVLRMLKLLPNLGSITEKARLVSLPTDGTVYDPELASCCSCEPERAAGIAIQLEKQRAEANKLCFEAQLLEVEVTRRKMLLQAGRLDQFDSPAGADSTDKENHPASAMVR